jgi:hypothetical protein
MFPAPATNFAVRPKNVFPPVAVITATISPDGTRVCVLTRFLGYRQGFTGQRGLIDADVVALDELTVGRDHIAKI